MGFYSIAFFLFEIWSSSRHPLLGVSPTSPSRRRRRSQETPADAFRAAADATTVAMNRLYCARCQGEIHKGRAVFMLCDRAYCSQEHRLDAFNALSWCPVSDRLSTPVDQERMSRKRRSASPVPILDPIQCSSAQAQPRTLLHKVDLRDDSRFIIYPTMTRPHSLCNCSRLFTENTSSLMY